MACLQDFRRVHLEILVIDVPIMIIIAPVVFVLMKRLWRIEVSKREKEAGIIPDPDIDTYMKVMLHLWSSSMFMNLSVLL